MKENENEKWKNYTDLHTCSGVESWTNSWKVPSEGMNREQSSVIFLECKGTQTGVEFMCKSASLSSLFCVAVCRTCVVFLILTIFALCVTHLLCAQHMYVWLSLFLPCSLPHVAHLFCAGHVWLFLFLPYSLQLASEAPEDQLYFWHSVWRKRNFWNQNNQYSSEFQIWFGIFRNLVFTDLADRSMNANKLVKQWEQLW